MTTSGSSSSRAAQTSRLLYGDADAVGYLAGLLGDDVALESAIEPALALCPTRYSTPWVSSSPGWAIRRQPYPARLDRAASDARRRRRPVIFRIAPSARVLAVGLRSQTSSEPRRRAFVALGAPDRDDLDPLPCSTAETELSAALFRGSGDLRRASDAVGARTILALCANGSHLHLACHAEYRPSDPHVIGDLHRSSGQASPLPTSSTDVTTCSASNLRPVRVPHGRHG